MIAKKLLLFSDPCLQGIFFGFMQAKEDALAVNCDARLPLSGGPVGINTNKATSGVALRTGAVHPVLLVRHLTQVLNAIVSAIAIDVINLKRRRIFPFAQRPDHAMRQITLISDADADVTATQDRRSSNGARLNTALRRFANQLSITHGKQTLQFRQRRQRLNLGCHLNQGELATGQGVSAPLPFNFTSGLAASC